MGPSANLYAHPPNKQRAAHPMQAPGSSKRSAGLHGCRTSYCDDFGGNEYGMPRGTHFDLVYGGWSIFCLAPKWPWAFFPVLVGRSSYWVVFPTNHAMKDLVIPHIRVTPKTRSAGILLNKEVWKALKVPQMAMAWHAQPRFGLTPPAAARRKTRLSLDPPGALPGARRSRCPKRSKVKRCESFPKPQLGNPSHQTPVRGCLVRGLDRK